MISDVVGWPAVAASIAFVGLALIMARWVGLRVERDITWASLRAAVQLLAVGVIFTAIFRSRGAIWWAWTWVAVMTAAGTLTVRRRARHSIPWIAATSALAIGVSALIALVVAIGFGVVDSTPVTLVVIAGITIGNAVPSASLAVDQAVSLCRDRVSEVEALLSLGFDRRQVVRFMAPRAAGPALIPQVDRTKVVGLIALPGALTGLLLAGADPVDAVVLQLLVMYLVLGATAICVVSGALAVIRQVVTRGLVVADWARPGDESGSVS